MTDPQPTGRLRWLKRKIRGDKTFTLEQEFIDNDMLTWVRVPVVEETQEVKP